MTSVQQTWRLYRFDTSLRCRRGHEHRLYIGISNEPLRRVLEHAKDKPWFRHVTGWTVDERVFYSEADAREAERAAIHAELPLANTVHNLGNPCRMVFEAQPPAPRHVARRAGRDWTLQQKRAAAWAGGWAALAVVLSVGAVVLLPVAALHGVEFGAAGSTALLAGGRYVTLSRRKRKQIRRWVGGVVTAAAVAAALWMVFAGQVASAVSR